MNTSLSAGDCENGHVIVKGNGSGVIEVKAKTYILGGADIAKFPPATEVNAGVNNPGFDGSMNEYIAINGLENDSQLYNSVKVCPECNKVCACTMEECNGCGSLSLKNIQVSLTNNILVAFIHGIALNGSLPLKVGIRLETEDVLVFDDPLAITRAHVCAIPTDVYIPDVRYLFEHPRKGLELVNKLSNSAWEATENHFLNNGNWSEKALSQEARSLDRASIRKHVIAGFNFPPSQYQLHLQYVLPPLTPFHYGMFRAGHHFLPHRTFPLIWVEQALTSLVTQKLRITDATSMDSIDFCEKVKDKTGVDYDEIHAAEYDRYLTSHKLFANYSVNDFEYALPEKDTSAPPLELSTLLEKGEEVVVTGVTRKQVDDQDKLALQSYGRPYDSSEKPTGCYYSFPKPAPLPVLNDDDD